MKKYTAHRYAFCLVAISCAAPPTEGGADDPVAPKPARAATDSLPVEEKKRKKSRSETSATRPAPEIQENAARGGAVASPATRTAAPPHPNDRLDKIERRLRDLEKGAEAAAEKEQPELMAGGVLTREAARLRLSGKAEVLFIDSETEADPVLGTTEEPDPHLEIERLRLEPGFDIGRGLLLRGQIDFKPREGSVVLKEMAFEHEAQPWWWLDSDFRVGLQDRFFRPPRPTKNYPLVGNAFWRDETASLTWRLGFGAADTSAASGEIDASNAELAPAGTTSSLGQFRLHGSIANGVHLNSNEIGFDRAGFNDIVQDDRNVEGDFSLRELGLGIGYVRRDATFGDLELLAFHVNDRLSRTSREFLRNELTVRNLVTQAPIAGYGDSSSRRSDRFGVGVDYFLPATSIWGASSALRRRDGLRLQAQWIRGVDGRLERQGWTAHASYRWSFPRRLLLNRYLRSLEPIVRYSELRTNLEATPLLPGTWDRRQVLIGAALEITDNLLFNFEYTFQLEKTGGQELGAPGHVANDELMIQLVATF